MNSLGGRWQRPAAREDPAPSDHRLGRASRIRTAASGEGYTRRDHREDRPAKLGRRRDRQYKTVLVANEIMIVRSAPDTPDAGEAPALAADDTAKPAADAAPTSAPKRRRMKQAA